MARFLSLSISMICVLVCTTLSCASPKDRDAAPAPSPANSPAKNTPAQNAAQADPVALSPFADSLKKNFKVDPCCALPLEACAAQKPACAIAPRLISFLEQLDSVKSHNRITDEKIIEMMNARHDTFKDTQMFVNSVEGWPVIGDAGAPVTAVMYYSGTCPTCKTNFRDLHPLVTKGSLKGKVKIIAKPLSPNPANRAIVAAQEMGRFTDFMFELANVGRVDEHSVDHIVDKMYLDRTKFNTLMGDSGLLKRMEASAEEATRNGVEYVPTYFINGRKYNSSLLPRWIIDMFEYVYETEHLKK